MFNKYTISDELCSSCSLILSFTCFCITPFNPFLLYNTLSHGLKRHHHVVSHVIITWSNTSSIPHQYPIPFPHFIISLRTAATSITSTTQSFTIPTELPSSKIPKSKFWALLSHFSKLPPGPFTLVLPLQIHTSSSSDSTGFMIKLATYTMLLSYPSL